MNTSLMKDGYVIMEHFLSKEECKEILADVAIFRQNHALPEIYRPMKPLPLQYYVINGTLINQHFQTVQQLYTQKINAMIVALSNQSLAPLKNKEVGVNINIMPAKASSYRWHYDRNQITAILYLNNVKGGETIFYPNYRIYPKSRWPWLQRMLDYFIQMPWVRKFKKKVTIKPQAGKLVIMAANQCLHCVLPVVGSKDRIAVIFSYDLPETVFSMENELDKYLYTQEKQKYADPNYR